jgi:hypothetical protein
MSAFAEGGPESAFLAACGFVDAHSVTITTEPIGKGRVAYYGTVTFLDGETRGLTGAEVTRVREAAALAAIERAEAERSDIVAVMNRALMNQPGTVGLIGRGMDTCRALLDALEAAGYSVTRGRR